MRAYGHRYILTPSFSLGFRAFCGETMKSKPLFTRWGMNKRTLLFYMLRPTMHEGVNEGINEGVNEGKQSFRFFSTNLFFSIQLFLSTVSQPEILKNVQRKRVILIAYRTLPES